MGVLSQLRRTGGTHALTLRAGCLLLALLCAACSAIPTPGLRCQHADELAATGGWQAERLPAGAFELLAYHAPSLIPTATLTVYLEGDGFAWASSSRPSLDPTPLNPVALRLALAQPDGHAAWLARPCQYTAPGSGCDRRYWLEARFADEVIDATNRALDALKARFGARQLILVGYSGGAAVALLAATRRDDIAAVVTVAGNLDHRAWTKLHRVTPLRDSLNPADHLATLQHIPQWHFAGESDDNITPELILDFARRLPAGGHSATHIEPGFDHHCCWAEHWPMLWRGLPFESGNPAP